MKSPEQIRAMTDPLARLKASAAYVKSAEAKVEQHRAARDMAVIVARIDQGEKPVVIYRDTLDISRNLFNRIIDRAPAVRPDIPHALTKAKVAHAKVVRVEAQIETVREIRDQTALDLMNGYADDGERVPPISNAEVARITGLSTARVAQLRNPA